MQYPIGKAMLHVMTELDAGSEKEHERWLQEEYIPRRLALPGFISAREFLAVKAATNRGRGKGTPSLTPVERTYTTMFELKDISALKSEAYQAEANTVSPRAKKLKDHQRAVLRAYRLAYPREGAMVPKGKTREPGRQPTGPVLLHVMAQADTGHAAEIERWYNEDHLPEKMTIPFYSSTRRFERVADLAGPALQDASFSQGPIELLERTTIDNPLHLALYELEGEHALEQRAPPNPSAAPVGAHLQWFRIIYHERYQAISTVNAERPVPAGGRVQQAVREAIQEAVASSGGERLTPFTPAQLRFIDEVLTKSLAKLLAGSPDGDL